MLARSSTRVSVAFCIGLLCSAAPAAVLAQEAQASEPQILLLEDLIAAVDVTSEDAEAIEPVIPGEVELALADAAEPVEAPPTVARMAERIARSGDNQNLPFVIVDKASATAVVYGPDGQMLGATPALVGSAIGDEATPGVGDRELREVLPEDRTTHAGRFVGGYGPAADGRQVLWVDFPTALSMHPVVTTNPNERRLERLASATPEDNRITFGCINVPAEFYETRVKPVFGETNGVFYILPEARELAEVFPGLMGEEPRALASVEPEGPHHPSGWW
jgi:hypothetical protein